MKKVRYALGAATLAPAVGLVAAPAAHAADIHPQVAKPSGKQVGIRPLVTCGTNDAKSVISKKGYLSAFVQYDGNCLGAQTTWLEKSQTGLAERVQYYSGGGALEQTYYRAGTILSGNIMYSSRPNAEGVHKVCFAIVPNNNHNDVEYGTICATL